MNFAIIRYISGWAILAVSAFMLLPLLVSIIYREYNSALVFLLCTVIFGAIGFLLRLKRPKNHRFFACEGFISVSLAWILISLIGAVPFCVSGQIPSYIDAVFEIISGFTTTGASILTDLSVLSHGMSFWRCFSHWIGGMGVLVFLLAVIPALGGQGIYFMKAESTGPSVGKLVPKVKESAKILYIIYFSLTVLQVILLVIARMPLFDALCITFGTAGTGGFAVLGDSIASYSAAAKIIITVFMLLFGVNFNVYFLILVRKFKDAFSNEELRWYLIIYFAATAIVGCSLFFSAPKHFNLIDIFFQTSSIMTTTGFMTTDYNFWTPLAKCVLVILMFIGACAGSTGGGIKVSRFVIYAKTVKKQFSALTHPQNVKILRMDSKPISHEVIRIVNVYFATYILVFTFSLLLVLVDGFDLVTSFTAVAATLNNIGPGLEIVGPTGNYAAFSPFVKIVLSLDMLAGRLELFPLIVFFYPPAWRRN
ncbi:MAG: TrkH family potassium uptake protein [Clostridia bacterium]|nr:TrkH family potassium uptake protein [Clostridia bacterium]